MAAEKGKTCKTNVDIIVMKMIPMKQVGAIVMTWPVHKLLPLLRGFIPVSIINLLSLMPIYKGGKNLGPVVIINCQVMY